MKNQKILVSLLLASLLAFPLVSGAADAGPLISILQNVVQIASSIVAILCTLMIIWGGIVMLTAAGAADKISTGKQIIMWSVIGLVVALIAPAITDVVVSVTN
jgi:FtsH-binding integral membrane protein